jgi:hypothetical protein
MLFLVFLLDSLTLSHIHLLLLIMGAQIFKFLHLKTLKYYSLKIYKFNFHQIIRWKPCIASTNYGGVHSPNE